MNMNMKGMVIFSISSVSHYRSGYAMFVNVAIYHHDSLIRRDFSTCNSLQLQLSTDIYDTYHRLKSEDLLPSLTPFQLSMTQQEIENGHYRLGRLEYLSSPSKDMMHFLSDILPDYPDVYTYVNKTTVVVIKASDIKDSLVLMGLSVTLHRLIYGTLPENGFRLSDRFPALVKTLEDMKNVDKLYKVEMASSLSVIRKSHVLKAVKPFLGDGYVFRLVRSIFDLPIYRNDGSLISLDHNIPPIGEVSRLLFNVVLMDIFDREFVKCYPEIRFTRFCHEIFVATADIYDVFFDEKTCYALLEKTGLRGEIHSISRGGGFLLCGGNKEILHPGAKLVLIDNSRKIIVCDPYSYL
uniref:Uncharacterized protein orf351 n=1 Tax=Beta vulgaris subsp. maritima TaxID=350892 RepID=E8ZCE6_BETVM|nr:hypothetical protein [Beta vulgaris subsp. maritima]